MFETYSLNTFRCRLCSGVILAEHKSSSCPFCGAHDNYLVFIQSWEGDGIISDLSENSQKNLEKAMELELESSKFYRCATSYAQNKENKSIFQGLAKIEMEHTFLISKALRRPKSEAEIRNICFRLDSENIKNSLKMEERMKEFYMRACNEAPEPRVKEIFFGLMEAEGDHLEILREKL